MPAHQKFYRRETSSAQPEAGSAFPAPDITEWWCMRAPQAAPTLDTEGVGESVGF
jgi:hypothetical protein